MKFGPGSHAVSVLNFGKHWRAFASKVLQHLCWELVGCMSNCDRSFETDCLRCIPSLFVSELLFDDGLSWLARGLLNTAGGEGGMERRREDGWKGVGSKRDGEGQRDLIWRSYVAGLHQ